MIGYHQDGPKASIIGLNTIHLSIPNMQWALSSQGSSFGRHLPPLYFPSTRGDSLGFCGPFPSSCSPSQGRSLPKPLTQPLICFFTSNFAKLFVQARKTRKPFCRINWLGWAGSFVLITISLDVGTVTHQRSEIVWDWVPEKSKRSIRRAPPGHGPRLLWCASYIYVCVHTLTRTNECLIHFFNFRPNA